MISNTPQYVYTMVHYRENTESGKGRAGVPIIMKQVALIFDESFILLERIHLSEMLDLALVFLCINVVLKAFTKAGGANNFAAACSVIPSDHFRRCF